MNNRKIKDGFDAVESMQQRSPSGAPAAAPAPSHHPLLRPAGQQVPQQSPAGRSAANSGRQRVDGTAAAPAARTPAALQHRHAAGGTAAPSSLHASGSEGAAAMAEATTPAPPAEHQQQQGHSDDVTTSSEPPLAFKTYGNALFAAGSGDGTAGEPRDHHQARPLSEDLTQNGTPPRQQQQQQQHPYSDAGAALMKGATSLDTKMRLQQQLIKAATGAADDATLASSLQQGPRYRFNPDTGQLVLDGSGQSGGTVVRRYEEDWRTGGFYPAAVPGEGGGVLGWLRRWRAARPPEWEEVGMGVGLLRSAVECSDSVGHWCGVFGTFVQGLCGGLAVLAFFQTYVLSALRGPAAFLGFYSPLAQQINRVFYALISFSLITAASRAAFDQVAGLRPPRNLRVRFVDGGALALFAVAYVCNLVATPLDDQLTYEYARAPGYWELQPLPRSFRARLMGWHALNVVRAAACGAAWALASYRASPRVMAEAAGALAAVDGRRRGAGHGGFVGGPPMARGDARGSSSGVDGLPPVAVG